MTKQKLITSQSVKRTRRSISAVSHAKIVSIGTALLSNDQSDDPGIYDGAHVAVQIVGRRLQEEKILAITEILGDALGKHVV